MDTVAPEEQIPFKNQENASENAISASSSLNGLKCSVNKINVCNLTTTSAGILEFAVNCLLGGWGLMERHDKWKATDCSV